MVEFLTIDKFSVFFSVVDVFFSSVIAEIYGDQSGALEKIGGGIDRLCEGMIIDDELIGLIVYKKSLQGECPFNLEVKTFALINAEKSSGRGYGSILFQRLISVARSRGAESIMLTVSAAKDDALGFFEHKGFRRVLEIPDGNSLGVAEYSMVYTLTVPEKAVSLGLGHSTLFSRSDLKDCDFVRRNELCQDCNS